MNNYKELVFALRSKESRDNRELLDAAADVIEQQKAELERLEAENRAKEQYIAETIGKVIKERDEWKTLGELANKRAEDYREMRRQRDKAIKERDELKEVNILLKANCDHFKRERDAAIADLKTVALNCHEDYTFSACFACEHNSTCNGQPSSECEFEWRGVQEVET